MVQVNGRASSDSAAEVGDTEPWQAAAKRHIDDPFGGVEEEDSDTFAAVFEATVADSLKSVEDEPKAISSLKHEACHFPLDVVLNVS
jgi:hypothetical protein